MRRSLIGTALLLLLPLGIVLAQSTDSLVDLGEFHMRHGDFESARGYFEKAIKGSPGLVYAHAGYQDACREIGKDVFSEYERRYLANPKDPDAAYLYARLLVPQKAIAALKGVAPTTFYVHLTRARAHRETGSGEAREEIQLAGQKCPEDARALCLLGAYYEQSGELIQARQWYEKAVALAPKRVEGLVGLGNVLRLLGELDDGLARLRDAQTIDKSDSEIHYRVGLTYHDLLAFKLARKAYDEALRIAQDDVDVLLAYGDTWIAEGKANEAEKWFRRAVEKSPRSTDALRRLAYSLGLQGDDDPDKNTEALEHYGTLAQVDPLDSQCHLAMGWIFGKKGKFQDALKEIRQAVDLAPKEVTGYFFLGYTYDLLGKWDEAADAYEQAIKIDPEYARAYNNLGLDFDLLGKTSKALKNFRKAVDLDPDNADYAMNLGSAYYNAGKYKEAAAVFADIVDRHPKEAQAWTGLGRSLRQLRKYKEATEAYEEAIKLKPDDPDLHLVVGIIYERHLKELEKALNHYEQYIILGGEDPLVQDWIEAIKKKLK